MSTPFVKRRARPEPGSIPEALGMFAAEVRFYREIAPTVGVRVPACFSATEDDRGTLLELEDLTAWTPGADPVAVARLLAALHERWRSDAADRWPWLRRPGAAVDLVGSLFDSTWPAVARRTDCTPATFALGERLRGRLPAIVGDAATAGPLTLVHGDASMRNVRTSPDGEIALLDWEDVGVGPGLGDLAWLLVSSVSAPQWDDTIAAYGTSVGLRPALLAAVSQGILSYADSPDGSAEALGWLSRLDEAARRL
ncbi:phosphotransferase family protein [Tenggerimyces flavus]|uniref:Phosphotransferase family protein n=1 Tax=Tenggerimyces flavus TaxID=1708749 RepID=A0ABV7YKF1_9ACTN|nr:phosphotransferase [Tenggerimyces flavus]MBM7789450.1 hypothetical protein [Tenggerimyces flavus]